MLFLDDADFQGDSVCCNCVQDVILQEIVTANLSAKECSYCKRIKKYKIASPIDNVIKHIYKTIFLYYEDALHAGVPYEGGWVVRQKEIGDVLFDFDPGWNENFREAVESFASLDWYLVKAKHGHWLSLHVSDILGYGWEKFKNQVLYKTRYLFNNEPSDNLNEDEIPVPKMLEVLGNICNELDLVKKIPKGTTFFRVRGDKEYIKYTHFDEIGIPPKGKAVGGRMNPTGIPYFYVASSIETAEAEGCGDQPYWNIGNFETIKDIYILDLTDLPEVPSVFDIEKYKLKETIKFLHGFVDDLMKPLLNKNFGDFEYVPTQIISEYFRFRFHPKIDGLKYNSVKNCNGYNVAFFESENRALLNTFKLIEINQSGRF